MTNHSLVIRCATEGALHFHKLPGVGNSTFVAPSWIALFPDHQMTLLRLGAIGSEVNTISAANRTSHPRRVERFHQPRHISIIPRLLRSDPLVEKTVVKPIEK
jgi:hypothetical protein